MKNWNKNILWWYAFLLIAAVYVAGLFIDLTGDAGLYAAITRQMVESGDWLNLKIHGEPYDQKPHLLFWLAGVGVSIFGNTNFAFKIFPVLYGWLGFYFTYRLGKTLYSESTGKIAAFLAATSQIFFLYSFDIHTDIVLQTGVVLALWQLAAYLKNQKPHHFIFGFSGIGLAMLAKGPVGAVIPFFSVFFYLLAKKDFKQLIHPKWLLGVAISLIVISPSLLHLYQNFGWKGIEFYFITNNFGRISGEYAGSSSDPFFYLHTFFWAFLPWTVIVVAAVFYELKSWDSKLEEKAWGGYLFGGVAFFLLILSMAKGKSPNYFMLAVPPFAVLAGGWLQQLSAGQVKSAKWFFRAQYILVVLLTVLLTFVVADSSGNNYLLPAFLITFSIAAVLFSFRAKMNKLSRVILISLILIGTINLFLNARVLPQLFRYQGAKQAIQIFQDNKQDGNRLYNFALEDFELFFYADDAVTEIKNWEQLYEAMEKPGTWIYTNSIKYNDIINMEYQLDTVHFIKQRGMNDLSLQFLNPETRSESLTNNYLIKVK